MADQVQITNLTRPQFYDELWTLTGQELRIRHGLSPYRLSVICKEYRLPTPPMGHWIKVRHGTSVKRRPLPELTDPARQTIPLLLLEPDIERCKLSREPVPVQQTLHDPHPFVSDLQEKLIGVRVDGGKAVLLKGSAVEFDVTSGLLDRALRLLDALAKGFEAVGGEVFSAAAGRLWGRAPDGVGVSVWVAPASDVRGTDRLAVDLTSNRRVGVKSHWADTKNQRVEGALRPLINSIFETAAFLRLERLDAECAARQKQRAAVAERRRAEERTTAAQFQEFGHSLAEEAKRYEKANAIRRYVRAIRRRLIRQGSAQAAASVDEQWLQRAGKYADSMDPMLRRFPGLALAGPPPASVPVESLDLTSELRLRLAEIAVANTGQLFQLERKAFGGYGDHELWSEVGRVLDLCGYVVSNRRDHYGRYQ
ncbi:MAG: hypothetical protein JWL77_6763 [Chthonomonadaceae bacterium]|nr:hypothetical protein [Chthonomonadaceae bacterium]